MCQSNWHIFILVCIGYVAAAIRGQVVMDNKANCDFYNVTTVFAMENGMASV